LNSQFNISLILFHQQIKILYYKITHLDVVKKNIYTLYYVYLDELGMVEALML